MLIVRSLVMINYRQLIKKFYLKTSRHLRTSYKYVIFFFRKNGILIVKNFLSQDEVTSLRDGCHQLVEVTDLMLIQGVQGVIFILSVFERLIFLCLSQKCVAMLASLTFYKLCIKYCKKK